MPLFKPFRRQRGRRIKGTRQGIVVDFFINLNKLFFYLFFKINTPNNFIIKIPQTNYSKIFTKMELFFLGYRIQLWKSRILNITYGMDQKKVGIWNLSIHYLWFGI